MTPFCFRYLEQKPTASSFLAANKISAVHWVWAGSLSFISSTLSILCCAVRVRAHVVQHSRVELAFQAPGEIKSIQWFTMITQPKFLSHMFSISDNMSKYILVVVYLDTIDFFCPIGPQPLCVCTFYILVSIHFRTSVGSKHIHQTYNLDEFGTGLFKLSVSVTSLPLHFGVLGC